MHLQLSQVLDLFGYGVVYLVGDEVVDLFVYGVVDLVRFVVDEFSETEWHICSRSEW